jgi:hypothetical protein
MQSNNLSPAEAADAQSIIASLPPPWKTALACTQLPSQPWQVLSAPGADEVVLIGTAPARVSAGPAPLPCLWDLLPTGRLRERAAPFVPPGLPRPALVTLRQRPQHGYSTADWADSRRPGSERIYPTDPFLVGEWAELPVDPGVWGLGTMPLLDITVRIARATLRDATALAGPVLGFSEEHAAYPPTWPRVPPDPGPSDAPPTGIEGVEARWRDRAAAAMAAAGGTDDDDDPSDSPPWLQLRSQGTPATGAAERDARTDRRSQGEPAHEPQPATLGALLPGFARAWVRLTDKTLHRPSRIVAWRIMHAAIGCRGFLFYVRGQGSPFCGLECCTGHARIEDMSHAFLDCPATAPVIDWLIATWAALTGLAAPRTAAFLLSDRPAEGWPACADDEWMLQMWTRLRVATLGAIWRVRCQAAAGRGGRGSLARQAARQAAAAVVGALQRDWARVSDSHCSLTTDSVTASWWNGAAIHISPATFKHEWARGTAPVFCTLSTDGRPIMRLSVGTPVPLPP